MIFHELIQKPFVNGQKVKTNDGEHGTISGLTADSKNIVVFPPPVRKTYARSHGFRTDARYTSLISAYYPASLKQLLCNKIPRIIPI